MDKTSTLRVLIVEDEATDAELCQRELTRAGIPCDFHRVDTRSTFEAALTHLEPDLIISDFSLPTAFDGMTALELARAHLPDVPFVFVSGTIGEERAVEAMKRGATDYVLKDRLQRLVPVIRRALAEASDKRARARAEAELAEARSRLDNILASITDAVWSVSADPYEVIYLNPAVEAIWGRSPEFFNDPASWARAIYPDDGPRIDAAWQAMLSDGVPFDAEFRIVRGDGSVRWVYSRGTPIRGRDGSIARIDGLATDITERRNTQHLLEEQRVFLRRVIDTDTNLIFVKDWNGRFKLANQAVADIYGSSVEALVGKCDADFNANAEEVAHFLEDDREVMSSMKPKLISEERVSDASTGSVRWFQTVKVPLLVGQAAVPHVLGVATDITVRKKQEQRIERLNRIHAMLSGINSVIVRVKDREKLFDEACRIAVENAGFRMAWIAVVASGDETLKPVACRGRDANYLEAVGVATRRVSEHPGAAARAIRSRRPVIVNDIAAEHHMVHKQQALDRGYRALAALPLFLEDAAIGVIVLYATETGFFNAEEMKLLDELAGDISFALDHISKTEQVDYLAYYDGLTGLPNRKLFFDRLEQLVRAGNAARGRTACIVLDVERFRVINESFGAPVGDTVLQQLAQRLKSVMPEATLLTRLGGDRYGFALSEPGAATHIVHLLEDLVLPVVAQPFLLGGQELHLQLKAGIAVGPDDGTDANCLMKNAEAALQSAKRSGARYRFYEPQMNFKVAERLRLENRLRGGLEKNEFVLHYQPRVKLATGRITGLEALLRWQSPSGLVPPNDFVHLLEETGLIIEVGRWAVGEAVAQYARWYGLGLCPPRIALNVSVLQLRQPQFVDELLGAIAASGGRPEWIDIEITESMLMDRIDDGIAKVTALRAAGIEVSLDDFGTGYSSLGYLAQLPVTSLKIDQSFVARMTDSAHDTAIVSTIISLGRTLNLNVIAEGVETEEQARLLRLLHCEEGQGFLFDRALSPDAAERYMALQRTPY